MATWQAIVGSATYLISGGSLTYRLTAYNTGMPPVRRLTQRSPQQHGHTDLGFRYDARQMRLSFMFDVGSQYMADERRDALYDIWKALEATPIKLRVTRDNGEVRQIDCYVTGVLDMPDDMQDRIGSSQRFVVSVECPDPMWYDPTQQSTSFTSADNLDWWLALGTISSGNVEEYVEAPTQGQSVSNSVSVANGSPWTVFYRTNATSLTVDEIAFSVVTTGGTGSGWVRGQLTSGGTNRILADSNEIAGIFSTGTHDYMIVCDGSQVSAYRDNTLINAPASYAKGISGTESDSRWRSGSGGLQPWTPSFPQAAIYDIALSSTQRASVPAAIDGTSISASKTITYTGSFSEYPVITITGPITDPVLTNVSTGDVLDFTGITISAGNSYTIDCRFGYKTVKNSAGTNKIADLTSDSDLATFHLGADPEVSGGANALTLSGTSTDANTQVTVAYYNRYVGL